MQRNLNTHARRNFTSPAANDAHMSLHGEASTSRFQQQHQAWRLELHNLYLQAVRRQVESLPLDEGCYPCGWCARGGELLVAVARHSKSASPFGRCAWMTPREFLNAQHEWLTEGLEWRPAGLLPDLRRFAREPQPQALLKALGLRLKASA